MKSSLVGFTFSFSFVVCGLGTALPVQAECASEASVTRVLTDAESKTAMKDAVKQAAEKASSLSAAELKTEQAATGACCLYTYGVSNCTSGLTKKSCTDAAGTSFVNKWTQGKSCAQTTCP